MLFQNQIMGRGVEIIVSEVITVFMVYLFYSFVYLIFPRTLFFREILGLQQNRGRYRDFSYTPAWNTWISSPGSTLPTRIGHFFLPRMNFTLTHNNHPYSIMYLRAHSWCYISCGFGQKYNISIIITSYKYFHCPKNPLLHILISTHTPGNHWCFYIVSIVLPFPKWYIIEIIQYEDFSYYMKAETLLCHKGPSSQSYGFFSRHVYMWELDYKESWVLKNWCFWTVVGRRLLNCDVGENFWESRGLLGDQTSQS